MMVMDAGKEPTVCVDFDGVIHNYAGWNGPEPTGEPIPGAKEAIRSLRGRGLRVEIFSTRPRENIQTWLTRYGIEVDDVRDGKPYYIAFFDDRAHNVPVNRSYGLVESIEKWLRGGSGW